MCELQRKKRKRFLKSNGEMGCVMQVGNAVQVERGQQKKGHLRVLKLQSNVRLLPVVRCEMNRLPFYPRQRNSPWLRY